VGKSRGFLARLLADDQGQGTVEYILLLSVVVLGATQIARAIRTAIDQGVMRLGGTLEKDLKTGRSPVSVWKN
jgi:Flp pilus assembly pilin Flp